jgi:hypothetical protein
MEKNSFYGKLWTSIPESALKMAFVDSAEKNNMKMKKTFAVLALSFR